jgi:ABC-type transport system involved in Fe-S cluster assembly fused permease/ATPase subunit
MDEPEGIDDRPAPASCRPARARSASAGHIGYATGRPVSRDRPRAFAGGRALISHTGSGKTTPPRSTPQFYDATEGRVLVDGVDIRDVTRRSLHREISVVSQDPFLFSASVRENIAGVLDAPEQVERAARAAQAHEFVLELPQGYDTVIGERDHALGRPAAAARDRPRARDRPGI